MHFHALIRLDGRHPDDPTAIVPPPRQLTVDDLDAAIKAADVRVCYNAPAHPDAPNG